ncbi:hypothetical protein GPALN_006644 [Globodera pallida]|nr:hypothetical protein GPALN_006644 [Globodera pallida]
MIERFIRNFLNGQHIIRKVHRAKVGACQSDGEGSAGGRIAWPRVDIGPVQKRHSRDPSGVGIGGQSVTN